MSHIDNELLELYALDRIADDQQLATVEEHLLVCEICQDRLGIQDQLIKLVQAGLQQPTWVAVHATESGDVYLSLNQEADNVVARVKGGQVDAGKRASSADAAQQWCVQTFAELFPEHRCGPRCRA